MRFEQTLILHRFLGRLFSVDDISELKPVLERLEEGPSGDGQSRFFHALAGLRGLQLSETELAGYDARVMGYEHRLGRTRRVLPWSISST